MQMASVGRTAVEAWDRRWATPEGRADWLNPDPVELASITSDPFFAGGFINRRQSWLPC
jgi:hypothetical protein